MMAASVETHVQSSATLGEEAEPQSDDDNNEQTDSEGENNNNPEDEGECDRDVSGESDGEEAEDEDGGDEEDEQDEEEEDGNPNAGWAEAMANILGKKTPDSQNTILVKNKQLDKIKEKERNEQLERQKQADKKRTWEMLGRQKPDLVKDRESERALQRIATRGVVQLFNAVRKHQKTIDEKVKEVGGSERKKAKILSSVSKKDFIDVLRQTDGGSRVSVKKEKDTKAAADDKPAWSVLRDDYMMGATMKDWDKDSDKEEGDAGGQAGDSGSD